VDFAHGISQVFGYHDDSTKKLTSQNIDALPRGLLWDRVAQAPAFFEHLPWCPGGRQLWEALAPLQPDILTGVPAYCLRKPRHEKFNWCRRELAHAAATTTRPLRFQHVDKAARLGPMRLHSTVRQSSWHHVEEGEAAIEAEQDNGDNNRWDCRVITCWSEQKHRESGPGAVLIDDRWDLKHAWEAAGGIFIHHETGNVEHTLRQLREHGVLPDQQDNESGSTSGSDDDVWHRSAFQP